MKLLFIFPLLFILFINEAYAQPGINKTAKDRSGNDMLIGCCTREALNREPYVEWFTKHYFDYKVDSTLVSDLKKHTERKQFLIFMGTWCGDSRREVPRLLKVLDYCNVKPEQIKIVMVSNHDTLYKQSPEHEERGLNILRVPTLIVYDNNNELNRFVEYPVESIEKDLLKMLSRQPYKPNYSLNNQVKRNNVK